MDIANLFLITSETIYTLTGAGKYENAYFSHVANVL